MNDKHYNPVIAARLRKIADGRQWPDLLSYLDSLSNAQFRTAGYVLGERIMPELEDDDFWQLATLLVGYNAKAFLVTVLKSWTASNATRRLDPVPPFFQTLRGREEDQRKSLMVLLPVLRLPSDIRNLLVAMDISEPKRIVTLLLQSHLTEASAFVLTTTLLQLEDDRPLLIRVTHYLMKQGGNLAFNTASLLRTFFGLEEVSGVFSLKLQPFQLSRIVTDFAAFCKTVSL